MIRSWERKKKKHTKLGGRCGGRNLGGTREKKLDDGFGQNTLHTCMKKSD